LERLGGYLWSRVEDHEPQSVRQVVLSDATIYEISRLFWYSTWWSTLPLGDSFDDSVACVSHGVGKKKKENVSGPKFRLYS
jgi:hypothetical protein